MKDTKNKAVKTILPTEINIANEGSPAGVNDNLWVDYNPTLVEVPAGTNVTVALNKKVVAEKPKEDANKSSVVAKPAPSAPAKKPD